MHTYVVGVGRSADRQTAFDFGAKEFVDLENDRLEDVDNVNLVFDVIGSAIVTRSPSLIRAGDRWWSSPARRTYGAPMA